jgi:chromosome partitioning protein
MMSEAVLVGGVPVARTCRCTAVVNQKGGVGKTSTTVNVAGALAERGRQVLVVDLDPQGHLTDAMGLPAASGPASLPFALDGTWDGSADELVVVHSKTVKGGSIGVIPNDLEMFNVGRSIDKMRAREHRLARVLGTLSRGWDHILIDCPPSLDILTDNALAAAEGVLVPVQAEDSSLKALGLLLAQCEAVDNDLREIPLELHGLVVSLLRRPASTLARSVLTRLAELDGLPVLATIPLSVTVAEAWREGRTVVDYAPDSEHAREYRKLADVLDGEVIA